MNKYRHKLMQKVKAGLETLEFKGRDFNMSHSDYSEFLNQLTQEHRTALAFNRGIQQDVFTMALKSY